MVLVKVFVGTFIVAPCLYPYCMSQTGQFLMFDFVKYSNCSNDVIIGRYNNLIYLID